MIPLDDEEDIELTLISNESASTKMAARDREQYPSEGDIKEAIEKGDWAAVGSTAAILASSDSTEISLDENERRDSSYSHISSQFDEDDARAAELAELVESGDWDVSIIISFYDHYTPFSKITNA